MCTFTCTFMMPQIHCLFHTQNTDAHKPRALPTTAITIPAMIPALYIRVHIQKVETLVQRYMYMYIYMCTCTYSTCILNSTYAHSRDWWSQTLQGCPHAFAQYTYAYTSHMTCCIYFLSLWGCCKLPAYFALSLLLFLPFSFNVGSYTCTLYMYILHSS